MSEATQAPAGAPPAKKSKTLMIILIVLVILLAGGGGGAFYMWKSGMFGGGTAAAAAPVAKPEPTGVVSLDPFLVNLSDGGQAYLRATLKLLVATEEEAKEIQEKDVLKSRIRSAVLETLAQQQAAELVTPEGKAKLRESIIKQIESLKLKVEVHDVLFSDFVVQY